MTKKTGNKVNGLNGLTRPSLTVFTRKPSPGFHFSIETNWEALQPHIALAYEINLRRSPLESRGIVRRLLIGIWAWFVRGGNRHIIGDVNFLGLFLPRKGTVQTILDLVGLRNPSRLRRLWFRALWLRMPLQRSSVIITISQQIKQELVSLGYRGSDDIRVVPLSVHPAFQPTYHRREWILPRIVIVGSTPNKNIPRMLKALEGTVCSVTLVGQRTTALQALVAEVSVPVTHLSGLTPTEMAAVYQESDILLYASTYEGFGMPIVEAQACGCLVVTSDQEPMRSVAGFDSAVLVNPESVSDIREGVHSLIKSPELRAHLREQGYRNSALYEPSAIAKQLIEIYNEVF